MKRMLSLTLMCGLVCGPLDLAAQEQTPGVVKGAVLRADGVISGTVSANTGRKLSGIEMHLVDARGVTVSKTVTTRDGDFKFPPAAYDLYTVQCMDDRKVIGTEKVTLSAPTQSVDMTCTHDVGAWWKKKKWGVLTGLGVAATAIGAVAVVAKGGDASGSR